MKLAQIGQDKREDKRRCPSGASVTEVASATARPIAAASLNGSGRAQNGSRPLGIGTRAGAPNKRAQAKVSPRLANNRALIIRIFSSTGAAPLCARCLGNPLASATFWEPSSVVGGPRALAFGKRKTWAAPPTTTRRLDTRASQQQHKHTHTHSAIAGKPCQRARLPPPSSVRVILDSFRRQAPARPQVS